MNSNKRLNNIEGFPGYNIDNDGQVYNSKGLQLKQRVNRDGYSQVILHKEGRQKNCSVHRLVANAFIPKVEGKDTVNHIDGNKQNNSVSNLEWCTHSENEKHAYATGLRKSCLTHETQLKGATISGENNKRPVRVVETGVVYSSALECAENTGCDRGAISRCCNGRANKHHNLHFEFVE